MGLIAWYKRYPSAALNGMMELTLEERGAYNTVLDLMYARDGDLPDDDRFVAGWLRVDVRVWRRIKATLIARGKLAVEDGVLRNETADRVIHEALSRVGSAREAGLASAASKARKSRAADSKNSDLGSTAEQTGVPTPVPTSQSQSQKEEILPSGNIRATRDAKPKRRMKSPPVLAERPDTVDPEVWRDFQIVRDKKKAPLTVTALRGIETEAAKLGWPLERALAHCVSKNWQGFEAEWITKRGNGNGNRFDTGGTGNGLLDACIEDRARDTR